MEEVTLDKKQNQGQKTTAIKQYRTQKTEFNSMHQSTEAKKTGIARMRFHSTPVQACIQDHKGALGRNRETGDEKAHMGTVRNAVCIGSHHL